MMVWVGLEGFCCYRHGVKEYRYLQEDASWVKYVWESSQLNSGVVLVQMKADDVPLNFRENRSEDALGDWGAG